MEDGEGDQYKPDKLGYVRSQASLASLKIGTNEVSRMIGPEQWEGTIVAGSVGYGIFIGTVRGGRQATRFSSRSTTEVGGLGRT